MRDGLEPGETVVTAGAQLLRPEQRVALAEGHRMTAGAAPSPCSAVALALIACREEKAAATAAGAPGALGRRRAAGARAARPSPASSSRSSRPASASACSAASLARDVDVGDSGARRAERLAAIDPVAQELAVRSARAELSNASAQLETATATELRQRRLMEQNVVSAADFEAAEQAREAAAANVSRARANLTIAEEQLGYTQILADFDGVVTAVGAEVGQVVSPGETVVTVARPDLREAVIDVPAELAGLVGPVPASRWRSSSTRACGPRARCARSRRRRIRSAAPSGSGSRSRIRRRASASAPP